MPMMRCRTRLHGNVIVNVTILTKHGSGGHTSSGAVRNGSCCNGPKYPFARRSRFYFPTRKTCHSCLIMIPISAHTPWHELAQFPPVPLHTVPFVVMESAWEQPLHSPQQGQSPSHSPPWIPKQSDNTESIKLKFYETQTLNVEKGVCLIICIPIPEGAVRWLIAWKTLEQVLH